MSDPRSTFTLAAAGEAFMMRRLSVFDEPEFQAMVKLIREADASFVNLETAIHKFEGEPAQGGGGAQAFPFIADELKWLGFKLVSTANNHTTDYSTGSLVSTREHLDRVDLVHAGSGMNLAEAREAAYFDTKKGIVAIIAATTTSAQLASEQRPNLRGRPGDNPLRINTTYKLDAQRFQAFREVALKLGPQGGWLMPAPVGEKELTLLGNKYKLADEIGTEQAVNSLDLEGNLKSIRDARRLADWVVFSLHEHERTYEIPPGLEDGQATAQAIKDFAHACIDAGADAFVGHGPHRDRGIEIYEGKPIFYSIGNFVLQSTLIAKRPQDHLDPWGLDVTASIVDFYEKREEPHRHFFDWDYSWETFIAVCGFGCASGQISDLKLYPVTLGLWDLNREAKDNIWATWKPMSEVRTKLGRPKLADAELSRKIVDRVARMSKLYGTEIEFRDGVGVVRLR
jgi:poly-gamma-glutamate synthesis protein (capsule biosynthesis protein)